jgi:F0F1-type ATP synthase gamma subunit
MLNESHLKKRIKSINMTNKICQAMRLISIIKLKKINQRIDQIKIYYQEVYDTFHYLLDRLNDLFIFQTKVKNFVNDTI